MIPPLLVVGIGNTDRMRDMTPPAETRENAFLAQGGANQFLQFIVEELKPWVNEHYRTSGYSVLVGHSLGGLFALHTFISRPNSFNGFLVIDPSLNWNDQALLRQAGVFMESAPSLSAALYLTVSNDDAPEFDGTRRFVSLLDEQSPPGLRWVLTAIVAESHDSIPFPAVYQGLKWIFSDWDVEDQAEAMFSDAPSEDIFEDIDDLYRRSGERYDLVRETPYLVFESLLGFLAASDRLEEAAELTLRHSDRYPLPLVPNVIAGLAQMFIDSGDRDAAIDYLSGVLEIYPRNETARDALIAMGIETPTE
jgi:pimeloyl-ACP methyl ester carboxylesterase